MSTRFKRNAETKKTKCAYHIKDMQIQEHLFKHPSKEETGFIYLSNTKTF